MGQACIFQHVRLHLSRLPTIHLHHRPATSNVCVLDENIINIGSMGNFEDMTRRKIIIYMLQRKGSLHTLKPLDEDWANAFAYQTDYRAEI